VIVMFPVYLHLITLRLAEAL